MTRIEWERQSARGMVCTVDHLASVAGIRLLAAGGNAVDAAVGASAALAVTAQHMCGMGGDLWAVVHLPGSDSPVALNASGRAGSGADADALRGEGFTTMPFRGDVRSTPIPGCVDGWSALHRRFGRLPLADVLAPAVELAADGFPTSPLLAASLPRIAGVAGNDDYYPDGRPAVTGQILTRPGVARALQAIATDGRQAWYEGEFGQGLRRLAPELYSANDLARSQADWVEPISAPAWGHRMWTVPPNSQGYLSLAGAVIAAGLDLPSDPDDPRWAHTLIEASKQAAFDRADVLFEGADGAHLVSEARLGPRRSAIDDRRASESLAPTAGGGTIYLCAADRDQMGVSLMQSNASGFGADVTVPEVGVFLHNRGIGFSLIEGHPAELGPGRRPPSTLSPALVTDEDGSLRTIVGTMGGDGQPQVVLQLTARLLDGNQSPGSAVTAPRFTLTVPAAHGFDTWAKSNELVVAIEHGTSWGSELARRGHVIDERPWGEGLFGHAHVIDTDGDVFAGVADPRSLVGAAIGL